MLLNLLPIPGLDGYGALEPHLSPDTQRTLDPVKQWGFLILLLLLFIRPLNPFSSGGVLAGRVERGADHWWPRGKLTRFWSAWM